MPPVREDKQTIWPYWPTKFRTSSSQAEGAEREFQAATLEVLGNEFDHVEAVLCARVDEKRQPIPGSEFEIPAELVLIAIGFAGPLLDTFVKDLGTETHGDARSTVVTANTDDYQTSIPKVFAAGELRYGQSLVVTAIREGRQAARSIDLFLMGESNLPS
jgi:glutamate synthase (NADPH/NADH) small chain